MLEKMPRKACARHISLFGTRIGYTDGCNDSLVEANAKSNPKVLLVKVVVLWRSLGAEQSAGVLAIHRSADSRYGLLRNSADLSSHPTVPQGLGANIAKVSPCTRIAMNTKVLNTRILQH